MHANVKAFRRRVGMAVLGVVVFIVFCIFLYHDTRHYIFRDYSGKVSVLTEIGEVYACAGDRKWISISDKIPKLTEITPTRFSVLLETCEQPDHAVATVTITLADSDRIIFNGSKELDFKGGKGLGRATFNDMDFIFKDINVDVTIRTMKDGKEKSASHTFHFKAVQRFEQHIECAWPRKLDGLNKCEKAPKLKA